MKTVIVLALLIACAGCETTTQSRAWDLTRDITYTKDEGDAWQTYNQTMKRKKGDCEDFAIVYYQHLKEIGESPDFITGTNDKTGSWHAWVESGGYYYNIHDIGKGSLPGYTALRVNTDRRFLKMDL